MKKIKTKGFLILALVLTSSTSWPSENLLEDAKYCYTESEISKIATKKKNFDICQMDLADTKFSLERCLEKRCSSEWYQTSTALASIGIIGIVLGFFIGTHSGR
jgi:hypothetical protein